jgi:hypothetical protein
MQANQRKQAERAEHNSMSLILADKNWNSFKLMNQRSVPSSEVTKCDTNTNPRWLVTHLLHQMVHVHTTRWGCGHRSATFMRTNTRTTNQTTIAKTSKISSKSCAMEASCVDPESTSMGWCRTTTYSTSSGTKSGSSTEKQLI